MKLLDTNIVVYAVGTEHTYKSVCSTLMLRAADAEADYTIDVELLQEVRHVYHGRGQHDVGMILVDHLLTIFPSPIPITPREIVAAKTLMTRYRDLGARDAIHAAVVLTNGLEGIVSADKVFKSIIEIRAWDPTEEI